MGIYSRYTTAFLIILATIASPSATAATLHPVPSIAKALAAGPSGVMPSGLTVLRSQQLGTMLLKSQVQLAMGSTSIAVSRGASLSVGALARGAVAILKNANPAKLIGGAVIGGAIALIPGARVDPTTGTLVKDPLNLTFNGQYWSYQSVNGGVSTKRFGSAFAACSHTGGDYEYEVRYNNECWSRMSSFVCPSCQFQRIAYTYPVALSCPETGINKTTYQCNATRPQAVPFASADWDALEGAIPASDPSPSDVTDFWFNLCGGNGECMGSYASSPTLAGPPSLPSTQTTTTSTGPAGTTTTTKTTQTDLDYSNPDGVVARDRTTTTTTNPDGSQSTDITNDTGPVVTQPQDQEDFQGTFNDSALPQIEPFYDPIYKTGAGGVWDQRMSEINDSAFVDFMHSFIPTFSGSCPAFSLNFDIASWASFGTFEFWDMCWIFDFVKVCILVTAAFLCRALIFGG